MVDVAYFFGLGSRYSYLAFTQLERLQAAHGCTFVLHPLSSIELMELRGRSPFQGQPLSGQYEWAYRQRDAEQWADYYGVPYREPRKLPDDHRLMARACHAAAAQGASRVYCKAMFEAVFVTGEDIDADGCRRVALRAGLDEGQFRNDIDSPEIDAAVTAAARLAHARGVFGVPAFVVDDGMYWGNDRIVLLEHYLSRRA